MPAHPKVRVVQETITVTRTCVLSYDDVAESGVYEGFVDALERSSKLNAAIDMVRGRLRAEEEAAERAVDAAIERLKSVRERRAA